MLMKTSQLISLLEETKLSPEDLGARLGISGMTVRRWCAEPKGKVIAPRHERSIVEGIYLLIVEGRLTADTAFVKEILAENPPLSFKAALKGLGIGERVVSDEKHHDRLAGFLSEIGMNDTHKRFVDDNAKKIEAFEGEGEDWKDKLKKLLMVIRSKRLSWLDKVVAYGALFYLLTPFDLIPDYIPAVGLIDDFGILGVAVAFYTARHSIILER